MTDSGDGWIRAHEWYVPNFGPRRFRLFVGMTYLPYTLMNAAFVLMGSALAPLVHWDRAAALTLVYLVSVGISAHALDAAGPNRPWGAFMSVRQLQALALGTLVPTLGLGAFLAVTYAPVLLFVGLLELFFLFAYNLELFNGRFHSEIWFAFSWGLLPVLAGYTLQTNTLTFVPLAGGLFGFASSYVEANASQPYKRLVRAAGGTKSDDAMRLERVLKGIVSCVLLIAVLLVLYRLA